MQSLENIYRLFDTACVLLSINRYAQGFFRRRRRVRVQTGLVGAFIWPNRNERLPVRGTFLAYVERNICNFEDVHLRFKRGAVCIYIRVLTKNLKTSDQVL